MPIIAFAVVVSILVVVHELGHYLMAKWFGVPVEVFSVGFGPRLLAIRRGGTEYRLNALTGALLGTKTKAEKLGYLNPLDTGRKYWTFQKIIAKAEQRGNEKVLEMELKFVRGQNRTFFEVMMGDGVTLFFDAASGSQIRSF